jgi:hypothetical protein
VFVTDTFGTSMGGEAPFFVSKYWTWTKVYVCEQQKYFYAKLKI